MSTVVANPKAELPTRPDDEILTPKQLEKISLFAQLTRKPTFAKLPGTAVLRRYRAGEPIVRQGAAGWTAFYILKSEDVLELRLAQLETANKQLAERAGDGAAQKKLQTRIAELTAEIDEYQGRVEQFATPEAQGNRTFRHVATAHLLVDLSPKARRPGIVSRIKRSLFGSGAAAEALPKFIPNDGPADIRLDTRRAPMHEGELFGEMSCMSRSPRSATVVADRDCYMLEILRNILDLVRKDPGYKEQMDRIYRERVMGGQLRKLSIFAELNDEQFERVCRQAELITVEPGQVIWDQGDAADSFCVIRSGLVKIVINMNYLVRPQDIVDWSLLARELQGAEAQGSGGAAVWKALGSAGQKLIGEVANSKPSDAIQNGIVDVLNAAVKSHALTASLGKKKADVVALLDDENAAVAFDEFPDKTDEWSDLDVREFNRALLEAVCWQSIPKRRLSLSSRRTLAYLGRGDFFGETGVMLNAARGATCVGYNHPDNGQAIASGAGITPSRVELVRIGRDLFLELCQSSPALQKVVNAEIAARQLDTKKRVEDHAWDSNRPVSLDPRFEELGLIQGQKLMLIDLDRCTRCGDCVRACVNTHDDGASRLFLDGPRFGKFLVPNACRKCLDPVCMIGCPVGSIVRGNDNEIVIKDWCIGCELCAEQCPYGSIHMNLVDELKHANAPPPPVAGPAEDAAEIKEVSQRAVVCDLCSTLASKEPACVYHCPHDAAIRIDARYEFPA